MVREFQISKYTAKRKIHVSVGEEINVHPSTVRSSGFLGVLMYKGLQLDIKQTVKTNTTTYRITKTSSVSSLFSFLFFGKKLPIL